jgi:hypothetical protein
MALHFSNGTGTIYDKDIDLPIAKVNYQLIETDPTKYTKKRWWGEFTTNKKIKRPGNYIIEFDDNRKGECVIYTDSRPKHGHSRQHYHHHFNGRSKLRPSFR